MKAFFAFALLGVLIVLSSCGGDAASAGASETGEAAESELPIESSGEGSSDVGAVEEEPNGVVVTEPSQPSCEVTAGEIDCF